MNKPLSPEFAAIGRPVRRKEDERLVTGRGRFTDDFRLPGQTFAVMVRSPHPHARIVSIDKSAALAMPGVLGVFTGAEAVVGPSGSCVAMLRVFYPQLLAGTPHETAALDLAARTFEFGEFLVKQLGVTDVGARFPHRVTYHDGCHGLRELRVKEEPRMLLRAVRDLELVECDEPESCCGFGGLFSVKYPMISTAMAEVKAGSLARTECDYIVSSDPSCPLQLDGWLSRQGKQPRTIHLAEVLAGADA